MSIGQKLSDLRKEKHLSQEEVADILGVTRQTISKWETDQSTPDFDKIIPICELYGLSADELLGNSKVADKTVSISESDGDTVRRKKKALGISLSILGYFLSIVWIMIAIPVIKINPIVASAVLLLICGISTFNIVYSSIFYGKKKVEEELDSNKRLAKKIKEIIATIILVIYFLISFITFAWHITWIIWIVYALIEEIVDLLFELRGMNDEK